MKKGYKGNIEELAIENENFRKVIYTAQNCQLVLMSIAIGEEIGMEVHDKGDQFFRFEKGTAKVIINDSQYDVIGGDAVIVPAGSKHNIINTSQTESLKLYTLYTPPHHKDNIVRATRASAEADSPEFDGVTTE
jgi:mannose-6-phosphate isomerase-like protein (cupin superfamily)